MGRAHRVEVGDMVYHVLNRANSRSRLFSTDKHYQEFLDILEEALEFIPMRILAYCIMPNHWHLALYPKDEGDLSAFMQRVTLTHTQRYHAKTKTIGYGHIYQGRYKSFLIEHDRHFLAVVGYIERNAKRAKLVKRAEDWKWSSAYVRLYGNEKQRNMLSSWPVEEPDDYMEWVNRPEIKGEIGNIRYAIRRSRPYGSEEWVERTVRKFGLEAAIRDPWRPKTQNKKGV